MNLRRRLSVLIAVSAVLAGACNGSGGDTTTTVAATPTSSAVSGTSEVTTTTAAPDPRLAEIIPTDPAVTVGTLDNGLTYYVRENQRPGGRAQLRLVVNAGSAVEDTDQSGGAHFLEHMLFNGTESFPVNELTRVLESFGARFGPDVNAYTSFDETVYELGLPTDDPAILELAFDVLFEWAARATINQSDVEEERGVVLEEWRLRDAGVAGRVAQVYEDVLLAGTGYEARAPIGDPAVLRVTNADTLRRFYEDWYRPDLMAVVAVGDFASADVVELIRERFGALPKPADPRPRPAVTVGSFAERRVAVLADPDQPTASVEVYFPGPATVGNTIGDWKAIWARLFAMDMIATRLNDDITRGEAPFLSVTGVDFNFTRRLQVPGLVAEVASVDIAPALAALVIESERALFFGFQEAELERARLGWQSAVEQAFAGRASTQDIEFADRYVSHYLAGGAIPSATDEFEIDSELVASLTAEDVVSALADIMSSAELAAVILGPDDGSVPDETEASATIALALSAAISPRPADEPIGDSLLSPPDPVAPTEVIALPFDATRLVYPNGVDVLFLETDISVNEVVFGGLSPGGLSRVMDEDVAEGFLIAEIVSRSGAGGFDRVALETFLADQFVFVQPYMDPVSEGFFGRAATEDLETLLQLVHLTVAAPRADPSAVSSVLGEIRPFAANPGEIPGLASTQELIAQRWGGEPRYRAIVTEDELDSFDLETGLDVFADRFGDVGDFDFAFAGDFTAAAFRPLADTYLGSLPGSTRDDSVVDYQQDPPPGAIDRTVEVGDSEQGFVTFLFTAEFERDVRRDVQVELLSLIVDVKLRDRLREALSATYSPSLSLGSVDEPDDILESVVQVSGDPERLDEIVAETLATLEALAATGPSAAELATAREQLTLQYELVSNEWWVDQLLFFAGHPEESFGELSDRFMYIEQTNADDIRSLAALAFPTSRYVLVRQIPG